MHSVNLYKYHLTYLDLFQWKQVRKLYVDGLQVVQKQVLFLIIWYIILNIFLNKLINNLVYIQ